ncbi:MAG: endonuclease III [Culicoidibacterales bacterium]
MKEQQRVEKIITVFEQLYPNAECELTYRNTFELLVAVMLSAQTTDVNVNKTTPGLFEAYPTPQAMMHAPIDEIEMKIKTLGLFRMKAKNLQLLSRTLIEQHQGVVPSDEKALVALAGVGQKTANVVLSVGFGIPALAVDTHVHRVSQRLGLVRKGSDVVATERNLRRKIPRNQWIKFHHQAIFFGRYHCKAKNPRCGMCPLFDICQENQRFDNL